MWPVCIMSFQPNSTAISANLAAMFCPTQLCPLTAEIYHNYVGIFQKSQIEISRAKTSIIKRTKRTNVIKMHLVPGSSNLVSINLKKTRKKLAAWKAIANTKILSNLRLLQALSHFTPCFISTRGLVFWRNMMI